MDKPRLVLGLDVSTACIGVSIVLDDGTNSTPKVVLLTHISPKVSKKITGFESLILKKNVFEKEFLTTLKESGITDCVIEEPLLSANNVNTVATLLRFNGMVAEAVHRVLGIVPDFISSYDARTYSFPELVSLRRFDKKGREYPLQHIKASVKKDHIVLFGDYPFDIDKKSVMMNKVQELYPDITWVYNKKGEFKKENFDACDSLVCSLAYINLCRNDNKKEQPTILRCTINEKPKETVVEYSTKLWNEVYEKRLVLHEQEPEPEIVNE